MTWLQLYRSADRDERLEISLLLLERIQLGPRWTFAGWLTDSSRMGFIFPLLALQGISLLIGLSLGSAGGIILIVVINLLLVGLIMLRKTARELQPGPLRIEI